MPTPYPRPAARIVALVCLLAAGCGAKEEARRPVFPVRGSVLVGGKPAARAQVVFHPAADPDPKAPRPSATVKDDGTFALGTYSAGDGAPAGEYVVTVVWPEGTSTIGGDADAGSDRLGDRYSTREKTPLKATVPDHPTELPPFKLTR